MNFENKFEEKIESSTEFKKVGARQNKYGNRIPKKSNIKWIIISILLWVITFAILVLFLIYFWQTSPIDKKNEEGISFVINEGETSDEIANTLVELGLIRNTKVFKIYSKVNNKHHFVEGRYKATKKDSFKEIMDMIIEGRVDNSLVVFQILEGKNIDYIANKVEEELDIKKDVFIKTLNDKTFIDKLISEYWFLTDAIKNKNIYYSLEGYLFPDTYHFDSADIDSELIIRTMLNRTEEMLKEYKSKYVDSNNLPLKNTNIMPIHQVLTLASCAELESMGEENRRTVVGIFINRLQNEMDMGSDVTTYYAIKADMSKRDLTIDEINTDNPYNTRGPNMTGKVPIGPICSPSKEAIDATFNYKKTIDKFFVSDKNGDMYFFSTYEEHNAKIKELEEAGLWFEYDE